MLFILVICIRDCSLVTAVSLAMGYSESDLLVASSAVYDLNVVHMIEATILVGRGEYKLISNTCLTFDIVVHVM